MNFETEGHQEAWLSVAGELVAFQQAHEAEVKEFLRADRALEIPTLLDNRRSFSSQEIVTRAAEYLGRQWRNGFPIHPNAILPEEGKNWSAFLRYAQEYNGAMFSVSEGEQRALRRQQRHEHYWREVFKIDPRQSFPEELSDRIHEARVILEITSKREAGASLRANPIRPELWVEEFSMDMAERIAYRDVLMGEGRVNELCVIEAILDLAPLREIQEMVSSLSSG